MTAVEQPEWVPLMEGVRILARAASDKSGDSFTRQHLSSAADLLERAGREGRIRAEGLRYLDYQASPLAAEDWMRLRIHESNKLDDPQRDLRAFCVRITNVVVYARDVRSLLSPPSSSGADAGGSEREKTGRVEASSRRRGRKPTYDWAAAEEAFLRRVECDGWPEDTTNEADWQCQSDVEKWVGSVLKNKPSESIIRNHVVRWLDHHRPIKPEL